jgi:hypothetical protein
MLVYAAMVYKDNEVINIGGWGSCEEYFGRRKTKAWRYVYQFCWWRVVQYVRYETFGVGSLDVAYPIAMLGVVNAHHKRALTELLVHTNNKGHP